MKNKSSFLLARFCDDMHGQQNIKFCFLNSTCIHCSYQSDRAENVVLLEKGTGLFIAGRYSVTSRTQRRSAYVNVVNVKAAPLTGIDFRLTIQGC
jgi:hypothetical protein